jgi:hypothetical protein
MAGAGRVRFVAALMQRGSHAEVKMYSGPRRDQGMRQGNQNSKRMRGRNRKGPNPLTRSYESNGPDVKIRGTALHIAEKYGQLARDAHSSGDRVAAENYYQHAEHYYRIIAAAQAQMPFPQQQIYRNDDGAEDEGDEHGFGQRPNPSPNQPPPQMQGRPESFPNNEQPALPSDVQQPYAGNGQAAPNAGGGEQPSLGEGFDDGEEEPMHGGAPNGGGRPDQHQFRRRRRPYRGGGGGRPDNREGNYNPGGPAPGAMPGSDE